MQGLEVPQPPSLFVSTNTKTGFSINTAIPLTCRPTAACATYCYGLVGRICLSNAVLRQASNVKRFNALETASTQKLVDEALGVANRVLPHQDFLRFFGVGDLQPGSIRFISTLAVVVPELKLWIATRRFDDAARIAPQPNVHVMMGLDATTRSLDIAKAKELLRAYRSRYFASWVQREEGEKIPPWVSVIFAEHQLTHRASWTRTNKDPRTCLATVAGGALHDNACARCQRCFNTEKRQN